MSDLRRPTFIAVTGEEGLALVLDGAESRKIPRIMENSCAESARVCYTDCVALSAVSLGPLHVARETVPVSAMLPKLSGTERPANKIKWEIYPFVCR